MIQQTKAIILRTVKYGETSIIATAYTEAFGMQSYLVNGIRITSKKGSTKAAMFQPAALLEVVAYHNEFKNLQRLKEFKWDYLYQHIFSDVLKNAVSLFIIELFTRSVKQPESNADLFYFLEDALKHLDTANETVTANFPIFFALHLPFFFGFTPQGPQSPADAFFDIREGHFTSEQPRHPHFLYEEESAAVAEILKVRQPSELETIELNQERRRRILHAVEEYYRFHVHDFGQLKSLPVLREIMN